MDWRFGMNDVWGFEDLSDEERASAEEQRCEPGKKYYGDPLSDHDVAQCPFCGTAIWPDRRCPHLVLRYLNGSGEYLYINEAFDRHFWQRIVPNPDNYFLGYPAELVREHSALEQLQPDDILCIAEGLRLTKQGVLPGIPVKSVCLRRRRC